MRYSLSSSFLPFSRYLLQSSRKSVIVAELESSKPSLSNSFDAAKVEAERILHEETEEEHQPELIRRWLDENEHNLVVVQWSPDRKTLYLQAT